MKPGVRVVWPLKLYEPAWGGYRFSCFGKISEYMLSHTPIPPQPFFYSTAFE